MRLVRRAVDLTPAEFGLVEAVRGAFRRSSRADFLMILTRAVQERLRHPSEAAGKAMSLVRLEDEAELGADRVERGGRPPIVRWMTAEQWITTHAALRSDPGLTDRLAGAFCEGEQREVASTDQSGLAVATGPAPP